MSDSKRESIPAKTLRIMRDHNISRAEALRVAKAEAFLEARKAARK